MAMSNAKTRSLFSLLLMLLLIIGSAFNTQAQRKNPLRVELNAFGIGNQIEVQAEAEYFQPYQPAVQRRQLVQCVGVQAQIRVQPLLHERIGGFPGAHQNL